MMKYKLLMLSLLFTSGVQKSQAVNLSDNDLGEALIVPFYTVKNDLKTQVVVKNFTPETKAVKLVFKEKIWGIRVLSFNIYLAPFDEWSGELSQYTDQFLGESTQIEKLDNSCAPYVANVQMFLPYSIGNPFEGEFMDRTHIGYIELFEMGVVDNPVASYINHSNGVPNDCHALEVLWNEGQWYQSETEYSLLESSGGISVFTHISDQEQSVVKPMVFNDFLPANNKILHTEPGGSVDFFFNSSFGATDEFFQTDWSDTWDNINPSDALLLTDKISGSFDLNLYQQTEWLVTITGRLPYARQCCWNQAVQPFTDHWAQQGGCELLDVMVFDENGVLQTGLNNEGFQLCESVNVIGIQGQQAAVPALHEVFDQVIDVGSLSKGNVEMKTKSDHWTMGGVNVADPDEPIIYYGLPMIANAYEKATGEDSGIFTSLEHHRRAVLDNIFSSGF